MTSTNDTTKKLIPISRIPMTEVEWLIPEFVPIGKLTDLAGQMDQGKSLLTEYWAAKVSREGGNVLMFACEDDASDTIKKNLAAAGADMDRIFILDDDALDASSLRAYCESLGNVRLVTVDPLTGFFPRGVDAWNTPQVRRFLRPLIQVAREFRFALVGVQHVNRRNDSDPLARIADAQGIPQVARSVLVWGTDGGGDEDGRVLATAKNNLVKGRPAASFRIESAEVRMDGKRVIAPRLVHLGVSVTRADDLVADAETRTLTSEAKDWLAEHLAHGPAAGELVKQAAKDAGITERPLRTAREALCKRPYRADPSNTKTPFLWELRSCIVDVKDVKYVKDAMGGVDIDDMDDMVDTPTSTLTATSLESAVVSGTAAMETTASVSIPTPSLGLSQSATLEPEGNTHMNHEDDDAEMDRPVTNRLTPEEVYALLQRTKRRRESGETDSVSGLTADELEAIFIAEYDATPISA